MERVYGNVIDRSLVLFRPTLRNDRTFAPMGIFTERTNDVGCEEYIFTPITKFFEEGLLDYDFDGLNFITEEKARVRIFNSLPKILAKRIPPKGRKGQNIMLMRYNLTHYDPIELISKTHGLSVDRNIFVRVEDRTMQIKKDEEIVVKIPEEILSLRKFPDKWFEGREYMFFEEGEPIKD